MKVLVAGDYCPQERIATLFEQNEFSTVFGAIKPIVEKVDYAIVNLESPVLEENEKPIEKIGPNLRCTRKGLEAIKWVGFNAVTLANNHILDYGGQGLISTIRACSNSGIDIVGAGGCLKEAAKILYKTIDGKTLALVNCCENEFSSATDSLAGANPLNPVAQFYAIKEAKQIADYVLVIVHGGHEHFQLPSPRMVETYRFFIESGADAVMNHHQHCFSGFEVYKGRPIFYGLGNLCFDKKKKRSGLWTEGVMVLLTLNETVSFELIPYQQCFADATIQLVEKDAYDQRISNLNEVICDDFRLKEEVNKFFATRASIYSNIFEPFYNRFYFAAKSRGWLPSLISKKKWLKAKNIVSCESHRDIILYYLGKK